MLENDVIRFVIFLLVLIGMFSLERTLPRRRKAFSIGSRWSTNLGLALLNGVIVQLLFSAPAVIGAAVIAQERGWGLFYFFGVPSALQYILTIVLMDFAIFWQHVAFHEIPWLWRLHKVHHSDLDFDASLGVRFHPMEILLSVGFKAWVVLTLGAPVSAVALYEVLLSVCSLFNHGNIRISPRMESVLRLFLVTPDMHRVHHSSLRAEMNSNYGNMSSLWDRLFRSYRAEPQGGISGYEVGLKEFRNVEKLHFGNLLVMPFLPERSSRVSEPMSFEGSVELN